MLMQEVMRPYRYPFDDHFVLLEIIHSNPLI